MGLGFPFEATHAGVENVWICGIDIEVGNAVFLVDVESPGPGAAAVSSQENPALFVGAKRVAQRAHVNDVGILRMNDTCRDAFRVSQSHVLPALSAISRLVDAVAKRNAVAGI